MKCFNRDYLNVNDFLVSDGDIQAYQVYIDVSCLSYTVSCHFFFFLLLSYWQEREAKKLHRNFLFFSYSPSLCPISHFARKISLFCLCWRLRALRNTFSSFGRKCNVFSLSGKLFWYGTLKGVLKNMWELGNWISMICIKFTNILFPIQL